ncbi:hypothetical protein JCM10213v2_001713 [Rhodosporidiobolus nylandii]
MQFHQFATHQTPSTFKRRARSPSPERASKLYASLPPQFARSLSVEALDGGSQRSSPGVDWLHQTEQLGLQTPPIGDVEQAAPGYGHDEDVGMRVEGSGEAQDHAMATDPPPQQAFYTSLPTPPPAAPFHPHASHAPHSLVSSSGFAFADPTFMPHVPSHSTAPAVRAPHDAPPLHQHLAGSPQAVSTGMTPSSSTGSLHSYSHSHPHPHPHPLAHDVEPHELDTPMSPNSAARAGKGGWKVTMGYRPDCEKCQQRVPGHYSHVVYSG